MTSQTRHERAILDVLDTAANFEPFEGEVWRIVTSGRNPLRGSSANGRWSGDRHYEVLYTSFERRGALAEIGFRLSLEPIWPSRLEHDLCRIKVHADSILRLSDFALLERLGVNVTRYQSFDYSQTQAIASAVHFLEFDGLIVPSARADCENLVLFLDRVTNLEVVSNERVDWAAWRAENR
jgi:hypothetical protein